MPFVDLYHTNPSNPFTRGTQHQPRTRKCLRRFAPPTPSGKSMFSQKTGEDSRTCGKELCSRDFLSFCHSSPNSQAIHENLQSPLLTPPPSPTLAYSPVLARSKKDTRLWTTPPPALLCYDGYARATPDPPKQPSKQFHTLLQHLTRVLPPTRVAQRTHSTPYGSNVKGPVLVPYLFDTTMHSQTPTILSALERFLLRICPPSSHPKAISCGSPFQNAYTESLKHLKDRMRISATLRPLQDKEIEVRTTRLRNHLRTLSKHMPEEVGDENHNPQVKSRKRLADHESYTAHRKRRVPLREIRVNTGERRPLLFQCRVPGCYRMIAANTTGGAACNLRRHIRTIHAGGKVAQWISECRTWVVE